MCIYVQYNIYVWLDSRPGGIAVCIHRRQRTEAKPVVSRRKILESLEEDDDADDCEDVAEDHPSLRLQREDSYEGGVDDDRVFFSLSSASEEEVSESGSFCGGGDGGEERFSRCFLLRSLADGTASQSRWALTPPPSPTPPRFTYTHSPKYRNATA
jgi:hypothetical protein